MDDYTDDEAPEAPEEEPAAAATDDSAMRKLKQENQSLRQRLRRTELEANFGKDVVELIPEELPLSKWEEFAGKLSERMPKPASPEPDTQAAEEPSPEEETPGLAAVSGAPASGAAVPVELPTVKEMKEIRQKDPAEFLRLMKEGKFEKQTTW